MTKDDKKKVSDLKPSDLDFLEGISMESVNKVAELDIIPSLKILLGSEILLILLELPKKVKFSDGNEYFCSNVIHNNIKKQLNCQAISLRFSLGVLGKQLGGMDKLIGKEIIISKTLGDTKERKNVPLYSVNLPVEIDIE